MEKRSFKEMTKGMTLQEKTEYLWEYYRWVLLVAVFGVIVVSMVVTGIVNSQTKTLYSGAPVNMPITEEGNAFLTEGWEEILGAEEKEEVRLFSTSFEDLQTASDVEVSTATAFQVVLMITAEDFDYVIMDEVAWDYYKNHPVFTALDEMFPAKVMEEYGQYILENAEAVPVAIDITQSAFAQKHIAQETKVYIAFPGNSRGTALNEAFLKYLNG